MPRNKNLPIAEQLDFSKAPKGLNLIIPIPSTIPDIRNPMEAPFVETWFIVP